MKADVDGWHDVSILKVSNVPREAGDHLGASLPGPW